MNLPQFVIGIDTIPGDQPDSDISPGIELIKYIMDNTPLKDVWSEVQRLYGVKGSFAYLGDPTVTIHQARSAKNKGNPILADWIAQSIHASTNLGTFRNLGAGRTELHRKKIASIIFTIQKLGFWDNLSMPRVG